MLASERKEGATAFLTRARAFFAALGVTVQRVMTDNGNAYRSHLFRDTMTAARCRHLRTRPYTPRTNDPRPAAAGRCSADGSTATRSMAERFIQTSLREWAYAQTYQTSHERTQAMQPWITSYNHSRPHAARGGSPHPGRHPPHRRPPAAPARAPV